MARRVGDELEYSKGILIRIISSMEAVDYETEFKNLESTFGFVLKKGIACLILPLRTPMTCWKQSTTCKLNTRLAQNGSLGDHGAAAMP